MIACDNCGGRDWSVDDVSWRCKGCGYLILKYARRTGASP